MLEELIALLLIAGVAALFAWPILCNPDRTMTWEQRAALDKLHRDYIAEQKAKLEAERAAIAAKYAENYDHWL